MPRFKVLGSKITSFIQPFKLVLNHKLVGVGKPFLSFLSIILSGIMFLNIFFDRYFVIPSLNFMCGGIVAANSNIL